MARKFKMPGWVNKSVIYEVNIRQYTQEGTFKAFAAHVPRLIDMGVNIFWLMPVYTISKKGRKGTLGSYYAIQNYTAINQEFGTIDDFKELVRLIQQMGGKVVLDWVANHTGPDHVWTVTHPGAYMKNAKGEFYERNGWEDVIDLNYYDGKMRTMMKEDMLYWVKECGIDGFRCDMAHLVPLDFWYETRTFLDQHKSLFWLGETETSAYLDVFDVCYAWKWLHASEKLVKEEMSPAEFEVLEKEYQYNFPRECLPMFFTSNHDENSWNGTEYERYGDKALPFAERTFQLGGVPLIYSGQELPLKKRLAFFDKDEIPWHEGTHLHDFYKELIRKFKENY